MQLVLKHGALETPGTALEKITARHPRNVAVAELCQEVAGVARVRVVEARAKQRVLLVDLDRAVEGVEARKKIFEKLVDITRELCVVQLKRVAEVAWDAPPARAAAAAAAAASGAGAFDAIRPRTWALSRTTTWFRLSRVSPRCTRC